MDGWPLHLKERTDWVNCFVQAFHNKDAILIYS